MKFFKIKPDYNFHDYKCGCCPLTPMFCGCLPGSKVSDECKNEEWHLYTQCHGMVCGCPPGTQHMDKPDFCNDKANHGKPLKVPLAASKVHGKSGLKLNKKHIRFEEEAGKSAPLKASKLHSKSDLPLQQDVYQVEGWFTLMDRNMLSHGATGSVHLKMSWIYDPKMDHLSPEFDSLDEQDKKEVEEKLPLPLTAMQQLQMNSNETSLKLGNPLLVSHMLHCFPVLFIVKRVTIRNINFFLGDLFSGYDGAADKGKEAKAIHVENIELTKALQVLWYIELCAPINASEDRLPWLTL